VIVLFLVTFVAGLATVGWMVVKVAKAGKVEVRGVGAD
jgi:putative aminopeptidase FrvX